jgi:type IV secretory pathway VirB2 component (pilin)
MLTMKKISIFFSFLFLFLVAVSSDSYAQALGCSGNADPCVSTSRSSKLSCIGDPNNPTVAGAAAVAGCTWSGTACTGATPTCVTASPFVCNNLPGCTWRSAASADDNAFVDTLCNALKIVTGSGGKAFAAFAIISCGIGFFTGKISWGLMIGITCGIAAMFGAPTIVAAISGGSAVDCAAS